MTVRLRRVRPALLLVVLLGAATGARGDDLTPQAAARMIALPRGLMADVWASEPLLENPVAFAFDERGRAFVVETHRLQEAVLDNRRRARWPSEAFRKSASKERMARIADEILDAELACRTVGDREALVRRYFVGALAPFTQGMERIKVILDRDGQGGADEAHVYADGFAGLLEGVAAGVLARKGDVWLTNIPSVWKLRDEDGDGAADRRQRMSTGYGVRYAFMGHDLHGLRLGPDGRMYWSVGDRGAHVEAEGRVLATPDSGAVFRSNLDGSDLEIYAVGLRNPQELAFDERGDLFTGDNNSDGGDRARLVHVVEGGDSGWRVGYQYLEGDVPRGPWNAEKLWFPARKGQPAYLVPPVANIGSGPSGIAYHPGTGSPARLAGHFFLADFRGQAGISGVHSFRVAPRGAGFSIVDPRRFAWGVLATDVDFGPDGALYLLDWVHGWTETGKGRIYRISDAAAGTPAQRAIQRLIAEGMGRREQAELTRLLAHPDMRLRQEAQLQLVDSGAHAALRAVALDPAMRLGRLHAIWGLGQLVRGRGGQPRADAPAETVATLTGLLADRDAEVRAQTARVLGDGRRAEAHQGLVGRLRDPSARVRAFAAVALGKLGRKQGDPLLPLLGMLRENADRDPVVRHAGVMGLALVGDREGLLARADDPAPAARMGVLLALRRMGSPEIRRFLRDPDPAVVREAARAINDVPVDSATPELAALLARPGTATDPVVRCRAINASFRMGSRAAAEQLAQLATSAATPAQGRREALLALADWRSPSDRDRVTGLWRPIAGAGRDQDAAGVALGPGLPALLESAANGVRESAALAAGKLGVTAAAPSLAALVMRRKGSRGARLRALAALDTLAAPELPAALERAAHDPEVPVRVEALALRVKLDPAGAPRIAAEALARGALPEKQAALRVLDQVPGVAADDVILGRLDDLLAGKVEAGLVLDLLESAGRRKSPAIAERLARYEARRPAGELAAFREALAGGDARAGAEVFRRAELGCQRCHALEGHGAEVGPELADIGARRTRAYLLESIVQPSKHFPPGFESAQITVEDGQTHGGVVKRETARTISLRTPDGTIVDIAKASIRSRERGVSAMPEGFGQILSRRDLRDVVEWLASLKSRPR